MCWSQFISLKHFIANKRKHVGKTFLWGKHFLLPRDNVVTPKSQRLCHPAFCLPPSFWKHPALLPFRCAIPITMRNNPTPVAQTLARLWQRAEQLPHPTAGRSCAYSSSAFDADPQPCRRQSPMELICSSGEIKHAAFFKKSTVKLSQSPRVKTINLLLCLFCRRKFSPNTVGNYPVSLLYIVAFSPFHTLDYSSVMC